jgi:hypothetical protein
MEKRISNLNDFLKEGLKPDSSVLDRNKDLIIKKLIDKGKDSKLHYVIKIHDNIVLDDNGRALFYTSAANAKAGALNIIKDILWYSGYYDGNISNNINGTNFDQLYIDARNALKNLELDKVIKYEEK